MDALVMCGGPGTRLDSDVEKPLFDVGGRSMVDRVWDAIAGSRTDTVYAVVSPHAPETRNYLADRPRIETAGDGYVPDLQVALDRDAVSKPVLTVAADLPLLTSDVVDRVFDVHEDGSLTVCVPAALKRSLGVSCDTTFEQANRELAATGLNVVGDSRDSLHVSWDVRLAVNVNRRTDAAVAEELL